MKQLLSLLFLLLCLLPLQARLRVCNMTCENLANPVAVDVAQPRLSWWNVAEFDERNQRQTSYQLQVASSVELLRSGKADLWDTGCLKSGNSVLIPYGGKPLHSGQDCYWRVRVWDQRGRRSSWSDVAFWHVGFLSPDEWKAQWITSSQLNENSPSAPLFRKDLLMEKPVLKAHLYLCGLGYFECYVDGQKVGEDVLVPNQTDYGYRPDIERTRVAIDNEFSGYRCLYLCYDLKPYLSEGRHALGFLLGNGFYNSGNAFAMPYGQPRLIAQLHVTYSDGTNDVIMSDSSWLTKPSAITMNGVYSGEHYDARRFDPDWCNPLSFNRPEWMPAVPIVAPEGRLEAQMGPSDRVTKVYHPVSIIHTEEPSSDGSHQSFIDEVDFGEEISGWVHLRNLKGKAGERITIEYVSESPNGENIYTMRGGAPEDYHPRFTWFVFRKVRISGLSYPLSKDDVTGEAVNSDLRQTGTFACSDTLLTKIHHIWCRTLLDNAHGSIISDCPHRERAAYLGDGQVACDMVMSTFNARSLYYKWFADMRLAQNPRTGFVPFGAPWQPGCGGGVPWSAAMILMPYAYYRHYSDLQVLEENYPSMLALMDYFSQWVNEDGIMEQRYEAKNDMSVWCNLGEWCTPTSEMPSKALVHTYFYWRCAEAMAKISQLLDKTEDANHYRTISTNTWKAFHHCFYHQTEKTYGGAGSNLFAMDMGLPDDRKNEVAATVRRELKAHGGHLYTGIFGTRLFFDVLAKNGMAQEAVEAFRKTDFPSFGHWIKQGATTTWEQWDGGNSHCHPMFGGGLTWLYSWLGGLQEISGRNLTLRPHLPAGIDWAESSCENNYGIVRVRTERTADGLKIEVDVPVGCSAEVSTDSDGNPKNVGSGHHVLWFDGAEE